MSTTRTRRQTARTLALVLCTCMGCAARTASVASPNEADPTASRVQVLEAGLHVRQVAVGAYEITHELPWPANSLLVEMADQSLVLAGTPYTPEATSRLLDWVRTRFGERRIVAINNGYHVDNLGGNAALVAAKIPVYGSDLTTRLLRERGETTRLHILKMIGNPASPAHAIHERIRYVPPTHVFPISEGLTLNFGGETVRVMYAGPSQAPDKVVVYFPTRRLLYGGCMILSGAKVGNIAEADLDSWPQAVRTLVQLPVSVVIPGHGDRLDPELIQNTLDVLAQVRDGEVRQK